MNIWRNIYLQSKISDEVFETFLFLVTTVFTHPIFYDTIHIVCVSFAVQMTKLVFNTSLIGHPSNIWDLQIIRCLLYYSPYFTCANEYDIGITLSQYIGLYTSTYISANLHLNSFNCDSSDNCLYFCFFIEVEARLEESIRALHCGSRAGRLVGL